MFHLQNTNLKGPKTVMNFLGFKIDTIKMLVIIPDAKCKELRETLHLLVQRKATLKHKKAQFFFTRAIRPERTLLRRLHKATLGVSEFHCHIRITQSIRQEVMFVCNFISM